MPKKLRIDQLLVDRGLAESRTRAQALILSGNVLVADKRVDKPGTAVPIEAEVRVKGRDHPWVSRGGLKLVHALTEFDLSPRDAVAIDVGASTGGFTHVLLEHGAKRVYAVDVGHGQLAWSIRQDERVEVLERTNARYLTAELIPEPIDWVVCDASFIGLSTVLPAALALVKPGGRLVTLIKPQFEAGRENVGKGGVVRDPEIHQAVCDRVHEWVASQGWQVQGIATSPITGPEGNVEFLLSAHRTL
ncbi:MAG: TlyA family RNA methyltransferase [Alphaproteobacteria bacterium]